MKRMNKKGFTLIELLAVIVILAIVAAVTMTVVVPMISGKNEDGAVTSVKEINKAVANACSADGASTAYGVFGADAYYTDSTKATAATKADCSTATGCYLEMAPENVKAMNISGDIPATIKMTVKNCQVVTACASYTNGSFSGLKVTTAADGTVTAEEGSC